MSAAPTTATPVVDAGTLQIAFAETGERLFVPVGGCVRYARGEDRPVDLRLPSHGNLSRVAGTLVNGGSSVRVIASQLPATGHTVVVLPGGHIAARLTDGNEYVLADPVFQVQVRLTVTGGRTFTLDVRRLGVGAALSGRSDGRTTHVEQPLWDPATILRAEERSWQTVVAVACHLTLVQGEALKAATLLRYCQRLHPNRRLSERWLSDRLDEALTTLQLDRNGTDKIPRIVAVTLGARLIDDATLAEVGRRVER